MLIREYLQFCRPGKVLKTFERVFIKGVSNIDF